MNLTTSLLRPLFCAPNELKFQSFPSFYNLVNPTTPLPRPHFHGLKVVVLTRFHSNSIPHPEVIRSGLEWVGRARTWKGWGR